MKHTKKYVLVALVLITLLLVIVPAYASTAMETNTEVAVSIDCFNLSFEDSIYIKYAVNLSGADVATIGKENFRLLFWTAPRKNTPWRRQRASPPIWVI